ncbi:MFS transporter [Nocardioides halotolerans]|uniref:MFS transporter n=1 Tax=Nocardioides halotolerans TaxID=433660 RepID=UPI000685E45C|nr:MFS transporter [Nocardioides halotolerans]
MTSRPRGPAPVVPLGAADLRRVVTVLCVTEILSWGVLFYAFTVLAAAIGDREGWPLTHVVAAFTAAQVVAAGCGLWVGRHLDRHGPRLVMTGGSVIAVVSVALVALAPSLPVFAAAWVLAGVAMSATLYAPAFATLNHWAGAQRVRALTTVTLVAGLASTVFAPLTALLLAHGTWRSTYLVLALPLAVTIPLHWFGLAPRWTTRDVAAAETGGDQVDLEPRDEPGPLEFWLLAAAFTLGGFCIYAVVVTTVPLLTEGGLSVSQAAIALGVGGAGQVAGRLVYGPVVVRLPVRPRTIAVLAAGGLTTLALAASAGSLLVACLGSFAAGSARGIFTLVQATAVADRWGTHAVGARTAVLSGGVMAASAFAPWLGTLLARLVGGFDAAFVVLAACSAVAAALVRATPAGVRRPETAEPQRTR